MAVTSVSGNSANGMTVSVANPTTTPQITVGTSVSGMLKGNGTAITAGVSGPTIWRLDRHAPNSPRIVRGGGQRHHR